MSSPLNISEVSFHVIRLTRPEVIPAIYSLMASGETDGGEFGLWVDEYSFYETTADSHQGLARALESMRGQETLFGDAPEFIRNEWVTKEGAWAVSRAPLSTRPHQP